MNIVFVIIFANYFQANKLKNPNPKKLRIHKYITNNEVICDY